jgi:glycosyltransferase involved in cell wall biosynthesis
MIRALASVGQVHLFVVVSDRSDLPAGEIVPPTPFVARLQIVHTEGYRRRVSGILPWARSDAPRSIAWRDWSSASGALGAWNASQCELTWFAPGEVYAALGPAVPRPAVVDLDDLESEKLRGRPSAGDPAKSARARLWTATSHVLDRIDAARWSRIERRAATSEAATLVCSNVDAARVGVPGVRVFPNGFELPDGAFVAPIGRPRPRTLTSVSLLTYEPNADAARFFAREVLPLVRRALPDVTLRLVGDHGGQLEDLARLDGVELWGPVEDLDPVFEGTGAVVAPIRFGSGTRLKVLEAFARRLPLVTTTIGCEGIAVESGKHAVVTDSPKGLADAAVALLTDAQLADLVALAGHELWRRSYRWADILAPIPALVAEATGH